MKSKHFLFGILFVTLIGFLALVASILIMVMSLKSSHSSDLRSHHSENKMFTFKSKNLNRSKSSQKILETTTHGSLTVNFNQCGIRHGASSVLRKTRIIGGGEVLPNNKYPWVIIIFKFLLKLFSMFDF
jgi:hypothetical protein